MWGFNYVYPIKMSGNNETEIPSAPFKISSLVPKMATLLFHIQNNVCFAEF